MMKGFKINFVTNALISNEAHDKIIMLKDQYWHYPKDSHEKWRQDNLTNDDCHLWIENDKGEIVAYLNLVFLRAQFNERAEDVIGIGNVCVDKELSGKGIGLLLMQICNYYIANHEKRAVLLCKKSLSGFYKKSGWIEYSGNVLLNGTIFEELTMLNILPKETSIKIERNF